MKNKKNRRRIPRYPNSADRQYYLNKLLDAALATVTGIGAIITLAFLLLL